MFQIPTLINGDKNRSGALEIRYPKDSDIELVIEMLKEQNISPRTYVKGLLLATKGLEALKHNPDLTMAELEALALHSLSVLEGLSAAVKLQLLMLKNQLSTAEMLSNSVGLSYLPQPSVNTALAEELERRKKETTTANLLDSLLPD